MQNIAFPPPLASQSSCTWNGSVFLIDGKEFPILAYETAVSGWTDELTSFHEETAGENHYIDVASRNRAIAALMPRIKPDALIIDIGCSSGSMLRTLRASFPKASLMGADYISGPLFGLASSLSGTPFLQFNLVTCPLYSKTFDAVILLNVFEHIENDVAAMEQTFRITKPGGVAVIEVPAAPHLFDIYDKQLMHFRRYTLSSLCDKLLAVGFQIEERSYLGALVYPAFSLVKRRNRRYMNASQEIQRRLVSRSIANARSNPFMNATMRLEEKLRHRLPYPFGIRCVVTCRKPLD